MCHASVCTCARHLLQLLPDVTSLSLHFVVGLSFLVFLWLDLLPFPIKTPVKPIKSSNSGPFYLNESFTTAVKRMELDRLTVRFDSGEIDFPETLAEIDYRR